MESDDSNPVNLINKHEEIVELEDKYPNSVTEDSHAYVLNILAPIMGEASTIIHAPTAHELERSTLAIGEKPHRMRILDPKIHPLALFINGYDTLPRGVQTMSIFENEIMVIDEDMFFALVDTFANQLKVEFLEYRNLKQNNKTNSSKED